MRTHVTSPSRRSPVLVAVLVVVSAAGCRDCDGLGAVHAAGSIEPAVFDFGPLTPGQKCVANLKVVNKGQEDLTVKKVALDAPAGNFVIEKSPAVVRIGSNQDLNVQYTVGSVDGTVEHTGLKLDTDDPDNGGVLRATISAIVSANPAPAAKSQCGTDAAPKAPCDLVDFGATQQGGAGIVLPVKVVNDGSADMHISAAVIFNGDPDFTVDSVQIGTTLVQGFPGTPITLPPGRSTDCGTPTGTDANVATFNVKYVPSAIGADADTLTVLTDAVSVDGVAGSEVDVPLSGVGSDVGILIACPSGEDGCGSDGTTAVINFGELAEGSTQSIAVDVSNEGTSNASVNTSCISLHNDGTCDANCTGQPEDAGLNGSLTCKVTKSDGSLESLGFVLGPTDATAGGDDERTITVTWAPVAGADAIPSTAVLQLSSNILGGKVFTAAVVGGAVGVISGSTPDGSCAGGPSADACVHATGDPADFSTWAGTVTLRLTNTGAATVTLGAITKDGNAGIVDDYTIGAPSQTTIAPQDHADIVVSYSEATGGDAGASDESMNVIVNHDGAGGSTTIEINVIPPT